MSKKVINVISVLFAVALMIIVFALLLTTYSAVQKDAYEEMDFLSSVLLMLTSSFGIYYVLAGCKKGEGSRYYVWFMGALAVCDLIAIASSASPTVNLFLAVSVAANTVLCFAKDLGHVRSTVFSLAALFCKGAVIGALLATSGAVSANAIAAVILSAMAAFMVQAKYYDKSTRGSK